MSKNIDKGSLDVIGFNNGMYKYTPSTGSSTSSQEMFELVQDGTERAFRFDLVSQHLRWLMGQVLTVIDASIENPNKLKAVKDLIKDKFSYKIDWLYELSGLAENQQNGLIDPEDVIAKEE